MVSAVFLKKQITGGAENVEFRHGIAVSWVGNKSPRVPTSSYSAEIQELFYGCDMARMLKGLLDALMFGNMRSAIPTQMYEAIIQMHRIK